MDSSPLLTDSAAEIASPFPFPIRHLLLLLLVAGCLFFLGLGRLPLVEPDEGRNAEVAREMLASGDWLTPHYNTLTYLDKPAVFFWMVALSFRAWGVTEWAARLPSALMALGTILLAWVLARHMFDGATGLRSGVILATAPLFLALARLVTFDMTLTFFMTLALASYWRAEERSPGSAPLNALMFGAMGVATITKGPVGFLIPLLTIVAYHALGGRLGELKRLRWGLGLAVLLAVVLPWLIAVSIRHPEFPRYALWQESLKRFATGHARRAGSPGYYIPIYLAGFFPWSLFLLFAAWNRLKRWRELRQERRKPVVFLLAWAGVVFAFFSISQSKLPAYFLPALIPLSLLMARAWAEVETESAGRAPDWLTAGFAAVLVLGLAVAFASQFAFFGGLEARALKKLHPAVLAALKPCLFYSGVILAALAVVGRNFSKRARGATAAAATFMFVALAAPFLVLRWLRPLETYAASNSSRALAETLRASPEKDLPVYGYYYFRTGLPFYLARPVGLVTADASEMTSNYVSGRLAELGGGARAAAGPGNPVLADVEDVRLLRSRGPVLVLARNDHVADLARSLGPIEPLWAGWDYSVWKVPKIEIGNPKLENQK